MHTIDFVDGHAAQIDVIEDLKPHELLYIRIKSMVNIPMKLMVFIKKATKITSHVMLSVPGEEFPDINAREDLLKLGIKGFSLRLSHNSEKWLNYDGRGQLNSGDRDLVEFYKKYNEQMPPDKDLVVEFLVGKDTRVLAPTIFGVHQEGAKWVILNVEGSPTPEKTLEIKEIIDYLKIRGVTKLNVYFPFWKKDSRQWDISTQNTFAGLLHVHIDLSNRCTHSCIFCPLYSPDAIEEIKRRSGGVITEDVSNHMKKEINSEKFMSIVESLPWTVEAIQFGGLGDPLMHPDAVSFIKAARSRGFRVEVLSNMEYLEIEDIQLLHSLGGINPFDLSFIANISGGDAETYIKTRPKQNINQFTKVVRNLTLFSDLRKVNQGKGANITLMCVVTKENCTKLLKIAELAHDIGAFRLWFKPMEIHLSVHQKVLPPKESLNDMAKSLSDAIKFAESKNIEIIHKEYCEALIRQNSLEDANV